MDGKLTTSRFPKFYECILGFPSALGFCLYIYNFLKKKKSQTNQAENHSDVKTVKNHGGKKSLSLHAGANCLLTGTCIRTAAAGEGSRS